MAEHFGKRLKRWREPLFLSVALMVTLLAGSDLAQRFKFFYAIEESALDLRFALRGAEDRALDATRIVIIKIDDRSLYPKLDERDLASNPDARYLTESWPWNRAVHARLAERVLEAGARSVIFDLVFPSPNEGDFELLDTIEANPGKIVLGFDYVVNESALGEVFVGERLPYDDLLPVDYSELLGFVNIIRDEDGALRRAKLSTNIFIEKLPFTENADTRDRLYQAAQTTKIEYSLGARAALSVAPKIKEEIPPPFIYPHINYGAANYFETVSYVDVLVEDRFQNQSWIFENAIVFVGAYSDFFKDVVTSPFGDIYGVESQAHIARSLLNNSFYRQLDGGKRWLVLGLMAALLLIGTLYFHRAPSKGIFIFSLLLLYLIVSQLTFVHAGYILPTFPVLWVIILPGGLFLLYDFTISQYERSRLQGFLGRYVSTEIAELIAEDSNGLETVMKGANRPIVTLFADIRNFTSLSERVTPEQLIAQLNEYFERMISIIHQHRGSLNKYIGDAILGVWGGIHSEGTEKDCENAVLAALQMGEALDTLNLEWEKRPNREQLAIGIGISFGNGFVGNMGHSKRMEFAVMGDVVNLASRLEGATKLYDGSILVNDALARECADAIHFQEVDCLQVKGKTKAVPVYRPLGSKDLKKPEWLQKWEAARSLYLERDFQNAEAAFAELEQTIPKQAKNAQLFIERCRYYRDHPPAPDWDGTYIMESK